MNEISVYIKTVVVILLLKPALNALMPGKQMTKYISFVTGLIIITLLVLPFSKTDFSEIADISAGYGSIEYKNTGKEMLKDTVEKQLKEKFNAEYVEVQLDGDYNILSIKSDKQKIINRTGLYILFS